MMRKSQKLILHSLSAGQAPVVRVLTRKIQERTRLQLCVRAGGRCEFDGCNEYLFEHHVTHGTGVFGEMAHIVAFRHAGPRGNGSRPSDINSVENLMLLCSRCHKLIDDNPHDYSLQALQEYKANHESRILHVTALGPDRRTAVLVFRALIGGDTVTVPFDQIIEATAPRYPLTREPLTIDLTSISGSGTAFYTTACDTIKTRVAELFRPEGEAAKAGHVSIFALGPIPLLICLGRQLTNKVTSQVFQRHRDTETWTWKQSGKPTKYAIRLLKRGRNKSRVVVIMSLSGKVRVADLPNLQRKSATVYELTLQGQTPRPTYLRTQKGLDAFKLAYQDLLGRIVQKHGLIKTIDLFPAVPAPIAVLCGRELLPKIHPGLRVFDYDKRNGGYTLQMEV